MVRLLGLFLFASRFCPLGPMLTMHQGLHDWRYQLRDKDFEQHVEAMRHALEKHDRMRWGAPGRIEVKAC